MEEPGMVRGRRFCGTGLLGLGLAGALFFSPSPDLRGQDGTEGLGGIAVTLESSPERPVLGGSWRVSILVDHPIPDEVTVIPPELPPSLTFAQSRKETRFVRASPEGGTRWTLVEFLFVPQTTGDIVLEPFAALVGDAVVLTPAARATVIAREGEGKGEERHPRLAWDPPPRTLGIGEAAELTLRFLDGDPQKPLRRLALPIPVPVGTLLEEIPLAGEELEQGLALRLRVIPLEGNRVSLGPFPLRFETLSLEAPALSIALTPPPSPLPAQTAADAVSVEPGDAAFDRSLPDPPPAFPESQGEPFPLFRNSFQEALDRARDYWRRALYAEALGELRRGERDLLSGPALVSTRRAAERLLGLPPTEDEPWRPRNFFVALGILSFCLLLRTIALPLRARRGDSEKKGLRFLLFHGYTAVALVLLAVMGLSVAALAPSPGGFEGLVQGRALAAGKRPARVLLRSCVAYHVPDSRGAVSARWLEGQPARALFASDAWAYAESSEGDAGWVSRDAIVFY
jgi:hypothetical protein